MSIWREIWKESLIANSKMFRNQNNGEEEFALLLKRYENDGMLYYARGEAYEIKGLRDKALDDYKKAKEFFPVEHWKDTANDTIQRVEKGISAEKFFNKKDFHGYLRFVFQKIYEFVHIDDFVRYVALSAISRASSEWPLSLIDFRTVLELQVNELLEEKNPDYDFTRNDLKQRINDLSYYGIICDDGIIENMHWIRKNGNKATHDIKGIKKVSDFTSDDQRKEIKKLQSFYEVMNYLNNYLKQNP